MSERGYPDPPWETHGFGVFRPCVTRAAELRVPDGFEPVSKLGRCAGMLAYVEYRPPSPLTYSELIWIPAMVRFRGADGKTRKGWWVARMYVDDAASLAGGRELWGLPKTMARFERRGDTVEVAAEDGTRLALSFRARSPAAPIRSRMATLQQSAEGAIRFRAEMRGRVRAGVLRVERFSSDEPGWAGFERSRPSPVASLLDPFDSTMQPPEGIAG